MILTAGKLNLERLMAGNASGKAITKIGFGTSDSAVSPADSALTGAVIKAVTGINYLAGDIVEFQTTLIAGDPAMIIREMGLYNSDDVLVHRKVITPKEKVAGVTYAAAYRVKIV